jgi:hypothetical protein
MREKKYIQHKLLVRLCALAREEGDVARAMFYIAAYTFMLRVRSEGVPLCTGSVGSTERQLPAKQHSALVTWQGQCVLRLARKMNKTSWF